MSQMALNLGLEVIAPPPLMAIILAAGLGQRLGGRAKAMLQIDGVSLLERLVSVLKDGGAAEVHVVVGPYRDELRPIIERCGAREVPHVQTGPSLVDSQRLAMDAHLTQSPSHDLLLTVADLPLLSAANVSRLVSAWRHRAPSVHALLPMVDGVRGHPLLLQSRAVAQVAALERRLGVRDWMQLRPESVEIRASASRAYITDVDTPEDVDTLRALLHPTTVCWPHG